MTNASLSKDEQRAIVLNQILELTKAYWRQYNEPVPLKAISQKWNKRARALDFDLLSTLQSDERFAVDLDRKAAYRITASANLPPRMRILSMLRKCNRMSYESLIGNCLAQGDEAADISADFTSLIEIGAIEVIEGKPRIVALRMSMD